MPYIPTEAQLKSTSYDDDRKLIVDRQKAFYAAQKQAKIELELSKNKSYKQVQSTTSKNLSLLNVPKIEKKLLNS